MKQADYEAVIAELRRLTYTVQRLKGEGSRPADQDACRPAQRIMSSETRQVAKLLYKERRVRDAVFGAGFFGEPAWDVMLDLHAKDPGTPCYVSSACIASAVPATTGLRYIEHLVMIGMAERMPDPFDRRRHMVCLTAEGARLMDTVLSRISGQFKKP